MLGVDTVIFEGVVLLYALRGSIFGRRQGFKSPAPFPGWSAKRAIMRQWVRTRDQRRWESGMTSLPGRQWTLVAIGLVLLIAVSVVISLSRIRDHESTSRHLLAVREQVFTISDKLVPAVKKYDLGQV
jgi:hypothetical protein